MRYHFFICKPSNRWNCQRNLQQYLLKHFAKINWSESILQFDVEQIRCLLEEASRHSANGMPLFKCWQMEDSDSFEKLPALLITTEYSLAPRVTEAISECLVEKGLMLYDAEMGFADAISEITPRERQDVVNARLAHLRHCIPLRQKLIGPKEKVQTFIYKLGDCFCLEENLQRYSVVDTSIGVMYGELSSVANQLLGILTETTEGHNEFVYCKEGCFVVENKTEGYRLRFVLEGKGESPLYLCWIEDGEVKKELLHRMGVCRARLGIKREYGWSSMREEVEYIRSRMYFGEAFYTRPEWRNPADRFVDSCKISRRLSKGNMELVYGRHPFKFGSAFCFCENEETDVGWDSWKTSSSFSISEEEAAPLLALVESVVPYYYNYYYDSFHVRKEEVEQILVRLKEVRAIVAKNPLDESLGKIGERLFSYSFMWPSQSAEDEILDWTEQKKRVLYSHRRELVALYDFFEWWLTQQKDNPNCIYNGFHIIGP